MTTQSSSEQQAQRTAFDTASATGRSTLISSVRAFGDALFNSAEYAARNRSNHDYVYDLYWAYLQYAPDSVDWSYWEGQVASQGRTVVRNAFADTPTFQEIAGGLYREVLWLTPDHLGTPRIIAERTGSLVGIKRHDYLPFGEELTAGTGGRTTAQGYSASDGVRQKFTQTERDIESGLDYAHARYYSSAQGRFTGADIPLMDQYKSEPQSWNLYAYVGNKPLTYTDPFGLWKKRDDCEGNGPQCYESDRKDDTYKAWLRYCMSGQRSCPHSFKTNQFTLVRFLTFQASLRITSQSNRLNDLSRGDHLAAVCAWFGVDAGSCQLQHQWQELVFREGRLG